MNPEELHFDEASHTYTLRGQRLPSVTEVIREVLVPTEYAGIPAHVLDHAAQRGRAVERMIELDLAGELDADTLHPELVPYWRAWQAFPGRQAWQDDPAWMSQGLVYSGTRHYAGTYDLLIPSARALVDIKATAQVPRTVGVQTAAYADAMPSAVTLNRYCLHVTPSGCKLIPLTNKGDLIDFYAALRVYQFRRNT